jgi:hypothetical protein
VANLHQQVESLQAQLREAQMRASEPAQPQAGGFLSGIFGGGSVPRTGSVPPVLPRADTAAPSSAWNTQPQAQAASDTSATNSAGATPQQAAYDQGANDQAAYDRGASDQAQQDSGYGQGYDGEASYQNAGHDDADPGFDDGGGDDDSWV